MQGYTTVAQQLAKVRKAWKRTAALSGLAAVISESAGVFAIAILVDYLYHSLPGTRVIIFLGVLIAVIYLLARHVISPLVRRIPDEQVALYVEEHSDQFEGALIAAAEFGPSERVSPEQAKIIDAIIQEADCPLAAHGFALHHRLHTSEEIRGRGNCSPGRIRGPGVALSSKR